MEVQRPRVSSVTAHVLANIVSMMIFASTPREAGCYSIRMIQSMAETVPSQGCEEVSEVVFRKSYFGQVAITL